MPVQKFSAMDPSGSWNMDARDQTAMWNADRGDRINMWQQNRVDQRGQDDWRKEVALKQLGLTEQGMNWNREDTAAERAAKYGFMGEELGLRREESAADRALRERGFNLQERGQQFQLTQAEQLAKERLEDRARGAPLLDAQSQIAQLQLERMRQQEANRGAASGTSAYTPKGDKGREVYQQTMAMTGDPMQAGIAAKQADRERSMAQARAAKQQLEAQLDDFSAKDTAIIGWDPTPQDVTALNQRVEALRILMKEAGMDDAEVDAEIQSILRAKLTSGGRTDWNAGPSEAVLKQQGGSFR
jgi:hypothetical protein